MAEDASSCQCPAGKTLYRNGERTHTGAYEMVRFRGAQRDCERVNSAHSVCALRIRLRRDKWRLSGAQHPKARNAHRTHEAKDRHRRGSLSIQPAPGTVEPVFADINHATGLRRFSLRGRRKVNAQWMMFCLAHNIGKIQRYGDIGRRKKERKAEIRQ